MPGATTRVTTGEDTGVTKAADAAMATIMAKRYGSTPMAEAALTAMGAMSTAVAVLESVMPRTAVRKKRALIMTIG